MSHERTGANVLTGIILYGEFWYLTKHDGSIYEMERLADEGDYLAYALDVALIIGVLLLINLFVSYYVVHRVNFYECGYRDKEERTKEEKKTVRIMLWATGIVYAAIFIFIAF